MAYSFIHSFIHIHILRDVYPTMDLSLSGFPEKADTRLRIVGPLYGSQWHQFCRNQRLNYVSALRCFKHSLLAKHSTTCIGQRFSKVDSRVPFCPAAFYSVAFYPVFEISLANMKKLRRNPYKQAAKSIVYTGNCQ